ncbi:hypothetical protein ON010_g16611 [Phytophthora cinnamomi]|nr:hypothetical protein ON010_g16611 [Phytophthora cinnamomi]
MFLRDLDRELAISRAVNNTGERAAPAHDIRASSTAVGDPRDAEEAGREGSQRRRQADPVDNLTAASPLAVHEQVNQEDGWPLSEGVESNLSSPTTPGSPTSTYPQLEVERVSHGPASQPPTFNPLFDQLHHTVPVWRLVEYEPDAAGYTPNSRRYPLYEFPIEHLQDASDRAKGRLSTHLAEMVTFSPNSSSSSYS